MTQNPKKIVVMARTDGLGERLCSMMNAIRFADRLKTDFRFFWTSDIWNPVYHKLDVKDEKAILGQSIAPQEEIFSKAFIDAYALPELDQGKYKPFPGKPLTEDKIRAAEAKTDFLGWLPNQNFLAADLDAKFLSSFPMTGQAAFDKIGLAPEIDAVVKSAFALDVPKFEAIHLRSGDMVFGEVRKWGQWYNKVLTPSVATDLIRKSKAEGKQVILFGQDVDGLSALADREGCLFVGNMMPDQTLTTTQRALFEIALMSRASRILAGYSGFSRAACMIGDKTATIPMSLYSTKEYADLTLKDLAQNSELYHPMVAAYGYWQSNAMAKPFFNLPDRLAILQKAQKLDPENLLHLVSCCALLYRMGRDEEAEKTVNAYATLTKQDEKAAQQDIAAQLVFKYYSTDFTHREDFTAFQGAAMRPNNVNAVFFSSEIKQALASAKR